MQVSRPWGHRVGVFLLVLLVGCTMISDAEVDAKFAPVSDSAIGAAQDSDDDLGEGTDTASETDTGDLDGDGDGFTVADGDCDDANPDAHPGASEPCDGIDEDCDGVQDEEDPDVAGLAIWYPDLDADGYGNATYPLTACAAPDGYVADDTDCYDGDPDIHPLAPERCNGLDDDCDGGVDEDAVDAVAYYADVDGDTYGDATSGIAACDEPVGYVEDATDCDDGDPAVSPDADETCNGIDDNCDGLADDDDPSVRDAPVWYPDSDGDGFGDASAAVSACGGPIGYVSDSSDCDDADASTNPSSAEICNGVDDDCDGNIDVSATDAMTYYFDGDGDGFGDAAVTATGCAAPAGHVPDSTDCYDSSSSAYPGQTAYFASDRGDGSFDYDCDGAESEEYDHCWTGDASGCNTYLVGGPGWRTPTALCTVPPACGETQCWIRDCADAYYACPTYNTQTCR